MFLSFPSHLSILTVVGARERFPGGVRPGTSLEETCSVMSLRINSFARLVPRGYPKKNLKKKLCGYDEHSQPVLPYRETANILRLSTG
jgi:hypothetical protein